jgi:hypothetical protein
MLKNYEFFNILGLQGHRREFVAATQEFTLKATILVSVAIMFKKMLSNVFCFLEIKNFKLIILIVKRIQWPQSLLH